LVLLFTLSPLSTGHSDLIAALQYLKGAYRKDGEHLDVQGQVGWSSEQPGLVEGVPAHGRGVGTR